MKSYEDQYRSLYISTVRQVVLDENLRIPFVASSPSNGIESERENWISRNPYDVRFGDVHFYDYTSDCLNWKNFPPTRFASEFGYQENGFFEYFNVQNGQFFGLFRRFFSRDRNQNPLRAQD